MKLEVSSFRLHRYRLLQDTDTVNLSPFEVRINVTEAASSIVLGRIQNLVRDWLNVAFPTQLDNSGFTQDNNYATFDSVALNSTQDVDSGSDTLFVANFMGSAAFLLGNGNMPLPADDVLKLQEAILRDDQAALLMELQTSSGASLGTNVLGIDALLDGMSPTVSPPTVESSPSPTAAPTLSPTPFLGQGIELTFEDILLEIVGVGNLTESDMDAFEIVTEQWYRDFFEKEAFNISNFETEIMVTGQNVTDGTPITNTLTYDQTITYVTTADPTLSEPKEFLTAPFLDGSSNDAYGRLLSTNITAFANVQTPISAPQAFNVTEVVTDKGDTTKDGTSNGDALTASQIAGIAVCAGLVALVAVGLGYGRWRSGRKRKDNKQLAAEAPEEQLEQEDSVHLATLKSGAFDPMRTIEEEEAVEAKP